ncbi:MAG: sodium:solute symporter [Verrucomicrobiae bacterium]|nr:sodium:solute symporter [Verrucomicrobiae bacterium]
MADSLLVPVVLFAYLAVQLGIGVWAARRVHSEADYLVAGRSLGPLLATFSLFATWFGAETVMGASAAIAEEGLSGGRADPFGYTLCLVLMAVLLAGRLREREYVTLGDFFRQRFGPKVEKGAVAIMVPTSLIWAAAQLLAFAQVIAVISGVDTTLALVGATTLVILYTVLGGLMGDVVTDVVQGGILIVGLVVLLVGVFEAAGGPAAALARIEASQLRLVAPGESFWARLDLWAVPVLGSLVSQEALARMMAARSPAVARRSSYAASLLYLAVGAIPVTIALVGTHLAPEIGHRDEFLPTLARMVLHPMAFALLMGALVSAILSTVDSTLLTVASFVSHTFVVPARPSMDEAGKVRVSRAMVVVAGIAAALIAREGDSIFDLVVFASSFGTAGILITVVVGLWSRWGGPVTAGATLIVGAGVTLAASRIEAVSAPFLLAVVCAAITYGIVGAWERTRLRPET